MTLPLPIAPRDALVQIIDPALHLLPPNLTSDQARVQTLAIFLQESGLKCRVQIGGPAHGLAQFERGGVNGVLNHRASAALAKGLCAVRGVPALCDAVYAALATDDVMAAGFARLLLLTDAAPLPALGDPMAAWSYYQRNWRPGRPHPEAWPQHYATALSTVRAVNA
ncbi:MAG: hypothetical protein P4L97_05440 [Dyella sp.]|nr:hypothetical protein [Dyella sp.]